MPLLAIRTIERDGWVLRPLADNERLVGATTADFALAVELFPSKRIVDIALDLSNPLPGPAMAWASLDAVFLDESTAARVSAGQLESLRAVGAAVAIRTDPRPVGNWPWERRGEWWVLPPDGRAIVRLMQPARYVPTGGVAGAPARSRRVIVLSLGCFAIAAVAASLWGDRRAWLVVAALSVLAAGGLACWNAAQPTSATVLAAQTVTGPWLDHYTQHVARADGEIRHPIVDTDAAAWPIFFSPPHARDVDLTLQCRANGTPAAFVAHLKRGQSIVFLNRSLAP